MSALVFEEGRQYVGRGAIRYREIDHIWTRDGATLVHWFCFLPVRTTRGTFHTPNRTCTLETFKRWAIRYA